MSSQEDFQGVILSSRLTKDWVLADVPWLWLFGLRVFMLLTVLDQHFLVHSKKRHAESSLGFTYIGWGWSGREMGWSDSTRNWRTGGCGEESLCHQRAIWWGWCLLNDPGTNRWCTERKMRLISGRKWVKFTLSMRRIRWRILISTSVVFTSSSILTHSLAIRSFSENNSMTSKSDFYHRSSFFSELTLSTDR